MLVPAAVTLCWVEAEEVWVVAATPVRTRTTTNARTISFMVLAPFEVLLIELLITNGLASYSLLELASLGHAAAIRIIGRAGRNRQHAGAGRSDLMLSGGGGGLGCGSYTGEDENDDECADDEFHNGNSPKVLFAEIRFLWTTR
jgi:hypothetical protein